MTPPTQRERSKSRGRKIKRWTTARRKKEVKRGTIAQTKSREETHARETHARENQEGNEVKKANAMEQRTETETRETNKTPTHKHGPAGPCDEWTTPQRPDAAGLLWQMGRRVRMPAQWNTVRIHIAGRAGTIRVASQWYATLVMRQEIEKLRTEAARVAGLHTEV